MLRSLRASATRPLLPKDTQHHRAAQQRFPGLYPCSLGQLGSAISPLGLLRRQRHLASARLQHSKKGQGTVALRASRGVCFCIGRGQSQGTQHACTHARTHTTKRCCPCGHTSKRVRLNWEGIQVLEGFLRRPARTFSWRKSSRKSRPTSAMPRPMWEQTTGSLGTTRCSLRTR